jgi:hypothetical protein
MNAPDSLGAVVASAKAALAFVYYGRLGWKGAPFSGVFPYYPV